MKIQEIYMQGIKDQNYVQSLTGKDIICGPNGVGKTTRLQALGISLLGYCPGNGKAPGETFKLATNNQMTVGLKTDHFQFSRSFIKHEKNKKDGSTEVTVSQNIEVSPSKGEKALKAKESRVLAEMGSFPVMLDFGEFSSLSDSKRRDFFYSLSPIKQSSWARDSVESYLRDALLTMELEINNPDKYAIQAELIDQAMQQYPENFDVQAGIQSMFDWAKNKQTYWNAEKKNAQGAVKKLSDLKNELNQTDRNIEQNKQELESLQTQSNEVSEQIARDEEKIKAVEKRLNKITALTNEIQSINETLNAPRTERIDENIKALEAKIIEVNMDVIDEKMSVLQESKTELESQLKLLEKEHQDLFNQAVIIGGKIGPLKDNVNTINQHKNRCVIDCNIGCNKDFGPYLAWASEQIEILSNEVAEIDKQRLETEGKIKTSRTSIQEKINAQSLLNQQVADQNKSNTEIQKQINALEKQKNEEANLKDQLRIKQEELQSIQAEQVEAVAPLDIQIKLRDGLKKQIDDAKLKVAEQEKARNTLMNLKSSMIDSKKSDYYADCSKYLAKALGPKGLQGELVKEILGPIQDDIERNLQIMGVNNPFYFQTQNDTGKEIFHFGWIDENNRLVNFDSLSTGEKMILLIAMIVTLLDRANPPCKVLAIDEIQSLDNKNFKYVMNGLDQMAAKVDNIILCGVIEPVAVDGWAIWNLSKEANANAGQSA